MSKIRDLTGKIFGRLQVVSFQGVERKQTLWKCQCKCGNIRAIAVNSLTAGKTKSCGCLHKQIVSKNAKKRQFSRLKNNLSDKFETLSDFLDN